MEKFKVGQMVKCVWSADMSFQVGREYEIKDSHGKYIYIIDDRGVNSKMFAVGSGNARFEPVIPKFTAVSGDQSLFDLVGAADDEYHIIKRGRCILSVCYITPADLVIAERKPYVEKYVPKVGEEYQLKGYVSVMKCLFIDNDGEVYGSENGYVYSHNKDQFTFVKVDK